MVWKKRNLFKFKSDQCLRRMKAEIILERWTHQKEFFFLLVMMSRKESSGRIRSLASSCTSPTCTPLTSSPTWTIRTDATPWRSYKRRAWKWRQRRRHLSWRSWAWLVTWAMLFCICFISAKQKAKQKVAKSQVVCRGLWLDCWIVGTRFESFFELKSLKTIISFLSLLAGIICSFFFCKL